MESDDTGAYFLVTRKVLDELDDCTITLPIPGNILQYDGAQWINLPNYSILDSVIFASSLLWNSLTHTLSIVNPVPTNTANSVLTTNNSSASQWTQFTAGSATKYAALSYNGTAFSGQQWNTRNLTDVSNTLPSANQIMQYVGGQWTPQTITTTSTIAGATDYNNTSPATNNQFIMYETSDSKFHPVTLSTTSGYISDISTTAPTANQVLQWNSGLSKYVPATVQSSTLASLTDCDINSTTPLQNSQILQYNSTLNKWINTSSANQNMYYYQVCAGPSTDYYSSSTTAITVGAQTI